MSMFGVTWYRAMRALAVSMHLSRPSPSFCTIAYWERSWAIAWRTLRFGRSPFWMSSVKDGKGRVSTRSESHAVRKRRAYSGSRSWCT
jgi:hypothetical protein